MINIDKFNSLINNYKCGNIKNTKKKLKKMNRQDRGLVIRWLSSSTASEEDREIAIKFSLWIIENDL